MKKRILFTLALLPAFGAADVHAAPTGFQAAHNICTPGALRACASIQLTTFDAGGGATLLRLWVRNQQGFIAPDNTGGSLLNVIGLTLPFVPSAVNGFSVGTVGTVGVFGSPGTFWTVNPPAVGVNGPLEFVASADGQARGGIRGCDPSSPQPSIRFETCGLGAVVFQFSIPETVTAGQAQFAFKARNTVNANDTGGNLAECRMEDANCVSAAPEPITMVLLGTGLLGVGGAVHRRRRKNGDVVNVND
ncbi:MAG: PEP-CTERM sorting domain-containing protein [Longimicrobiales bacterium]